MRRLLAFLAAALFSAGALAAGNYLSVNGFRLSIGGGGIVVTAPTDTTPDAFSFTDQTNVAVSSTITSAAITVSGINANSTITVSGGTYDINSSGSFTSSSGSVSNADTVRARHTSSASNSTAVNTVVTIGGVSDTFTSTTTSGAAYTPEIDTGFESGTGPGTWFDTYGGGSRSTAQAATGTNSLLVSVTSGVNDLTFLAGRPTTRLVQGDEVWVRFKTYFPAGFNFQAPAEGNHLKFFRIDSGPPVGGSQPGHVQHIDIYIRPFGVGADATAVGCFDFIQEAIQSWMFDACTVPTGIVRGVWQTWNFYYKLHATASSARVRMWRDSTNLIDSNTRATLGTSTSMVGGKSDVDAQGIMLMTYWNGGAPATQSFYVDDWQVATSASPPTATDSGARIWIGP